MTQLDHDIQLYGWPVILNFSWYMVATHYHFVLQEVASGNRFFDR